MFPEVPRSITGRLPATPSRDARAGEALLDLQFSPAYDRFAGHDHRVRVRGPQHWWRSCRWRVALAAHPAVGAQIVNALVPWLASGDVRTAQKAGLDVETLHAWKVTCARIAREVKRSHGVIANTQAASPGTAGDAAATG